MPSVAKELMMKEIEKEFAASNTAFISTFETMSVVDISEFRRAIEKVSKRTMVIKHSMVKKVFSAQQTMDAEKFLNGQILVTFGAGEPQMISKALVDFQKTNQKVVTAGMIMDGKVYGKDFVKQLANLPSRQDLLTQVVVRVQSPISGFVMTLNQIMRGFVVALSEVQKKKAAAGAA